MVALKGLSSGRTTGRCWLLCSTSSFICYRKGADCIHEKERNDWVAKWQLLNSKSRYQISPPCNLNYTQAPPLKSDKDSHLPGRRKTKHPSFRFISIQFSIFLFSNKVLTDFAGPSASNWYGSSSRPESSQGVAFSTHLNTVPRLRMSGIMPLLPLFAFMSCTRQFYLLYFVDRASWRNSG
jgi:hypothetical protein